MFCKPTTESTMPPREAGTCAGCVLANTVRVGSPFGPETWYCQRVVLNALLICAAVPEAVMYILLDGTTNPASPMLDKYDLTAWT